MKEGGGGIGVTPHLGALEGKARTAGPSDAELNPLFCSFRSRLPSHRRAVE